MAGKGSAFEREICKQLSLWWTEGERDDVFWRTSQSGGRATVRKRKGKRTSGHYGDIMATGSTGRSLMRYTTIEVKRGYNRFTMLDVLDRSEGAAQQLFEKWMAQAIDAAIDARSMTWWVIARRDRRETMLYVPAEGTPATMRHLPAPFVKSCFYPELAGGHRNKRLHTVYGMQFERFLDAIDPAHIREAVRLHRERSHR